MNDKHHIFSQLKETLHSHQEDYVPGAWEDFVKKRKRRRAVILFWRISGAAAILLLLIGLLWINISSSVKNEQNQVVLQHPVRSLTQPETNHHSTLSADSTSPQKNQIAQNVTSPQAIVKHKPAIVNNNNAIVRRLAGNTSNHTIGNKTVSATNNNAVVTTTSSQKDNYHESDKKMPADSGLTKPVLANNNAEKNSEVKKYTRIDKPIYDSLMGHRNAETAKKEKKNLSYAVVVAPGVGSQKLNFGTGFEIAYPLTGNLSLSSGVAYSSLHAQNSNDNSGSLARQLQGANLDVSGFEVPLGLTYKTKGGFYASAGVLAMTVVANHLEYDYVVQRTLATPAANAAGMAYQTMSLVSEKQTEPSQEKINNYLGFYQFSAGQKAIIGRTQFNLGPFVKLPFGSVSSQDIKLMQAGIRLGIGF